MFSPLLALHSYLLVSSTPSLGYGHFQLDSQDVLTFPLPSTHSALYPTGFRLVDVLAYDPSMTHLLLLEEPAIRRRFANAAPGRICDAVQRLQSPSDYSELSL